MPVQVPSLPNGAGGTATNVCDPTGGFDYTPQTITNFGRINLKRGHRVVELVLKYYFYDFLSSSLGRPFTQRRGSSVELSRLLFQALFPAGLRSRLQRLHN